MSRAGGIPVVHGGEDVNIITAGQAQPGDVLLDSGQVVWKRGDGGPDQWSTFDGPVAFYGPWDPAYGPQGELVLLVRDGRPARRDE